MLHLWLKITLAALLLAVAGVALAQDNAAKINQLLVESYDLLGAGKADRAKAKFEEILKIDPNNPLAQNNLAAVLVKEKKYQEALDNLGKAMVQARHHRVRVRVNRVCEVDGICLAFRPAEAVYGDTYLEQLIRLNMEMIKARLATRQ